MAVPGNVPGLTALLWATAMSTKNQSMGRELFGILTFLTFPSMNLWPRPFVVPWIIGSGTLLTPFRAPPSTQFSPHIKCSVRNTKLGLHAWRLPPHTLAYNLYTLVFSMYALDSLLLEGFGAGAYSAAAAALMAYRPLPKAEYSAFDCVLMPGWCRHAS